MIYVSVEILRFVDDCQPGVVECLLVDSFGQAHTFVEKIPLVSAEYMDRESSYPKPGWIACEVLATQNDDKGSEIKEIDTSRPWHIESTAGKSYFVVLAAQLSAFDGTTSS